MHIIKEPVSHKDGSQINNSLFLFFCCVQKDWRFAAVCTWKKANNDLVWSLTTVRWISVWVRSASNKNWFASPPKFSLQNYTVFRASSECTKLKGPLFSPERNEKLLAEDAGHKGKHLQWWHWRNQSSFIPPHQQQIEKLDSPDLLALCDESKDDGFAVRARRTDGCGKKLRHEYLFITNTGDKCIVSHAKFKDDTKTLTKTTAYSFRKFPLVKLIQLDKSHKITKVLLVLIVLAAVLFIYLFLFSKSFHCFLLQLSDERSDLMAVRSWAGTHGRTKDQTQSLSLGILRVYSLGDP